jgi:hypothetical protein
LVGGLALHSGEHETIFHEILKYAGFFPIPTSTYYNIKTTTKQKLQGTYTPQKLGRKQKLTQYELDVLRGFVKSQNNLNLKVDLRSVADFVTINFGKTISLATASHYLKQLGFSSRKIKEGSQAKVLLPSELSDLLVSFISRLREEGDIDHPLSLTCSMDFTYSIEATNPDRSFVETGGYF